MNPPLTRKHPSLCSACISVQSDGASMMTEYCITACRCDGCGRIADLAMVNLNKPLVFLTETEGYKKLLKPDPRMVKATLTVRGVPHAWTFDWNDRESVRRFAADSNVCILAGGTTHVEPA